MTRRKGELSKATIDREFPYQVVLPSKYVVANFRTVKARADELGVCVRGHSYFQGDDHQNVFCFPSEEAAATFCAEFAGKRVTPKTRPKWPAG